MPFSIGTTSPGGSDRAQKRCAEGGCRKKAATLGRFCGNHAKRCCVTSCRRRTKTMNPECEWHVNAKAERERIIREKAFAPSIAERAKKFMGVARGIKHMLQSGGGGDFLETISTVLGDDYRAIFFQMYEQVERKSEQYVALTDELARQAAEKEVPPEIGEPETLVNGFSNLSI